MRVDDSSRYACADVTPGERSAGDSGHSNARPALTETAERLHELSDRLLISTAMQALSDWCKQHELSCHRITIEGPDHSSKRPDDDVLDLLIPGACEHIETRSLRILSDRLVLSEVDHWFVPERVPTQIRGALPRIEVLFAAAPSLRLKRRTYLVAFPTLASEHGPTPQTPAGVPLQPRTVILHHKAVVTDHNKRTLAVTSERYLASLLGAS